MQFKTTSVEQVLELMKEGESFLLGFYRRKTIVNIEGFLYSLGSKDLAAMDLLERLQLSSLQLNRKRQKWP